MTIWWLLLIIGLTGAVTARRWLPGRDALADSAYDLYRALVPVPRPTVRMVTKRIARVCRRQRVVLPFGQKSVLPRSFMVELHPDEFDTIEPLLQTVEEAVAASLLRSAREKQWLHNGLPTITVRPSEHVAEGRPVVTSTALPSPEMVAAPTLRAEPTMTLDSRESTVAALAGPDPTAAGEPAGARAAHRFTAGDGAPDLVVTDLPVVLGRDPQCQVTVDYPSASRRHLQLLPGAAGCQIEDLHSRHGTQVNGRRIDAPILLRPGDTVQIGSHGPHWVYGRGQAQ